MVATYVNPNANEQLLVKVGDGASPEVFTAPVLINTTRSLQLTGNAVATVIPRTDDVSAPGKTVRGVSSVDWQVSGAGILHVGDDKTYTDWLLTGAAKNVKVVNNKTGGVILTGSAVLTAFEISGGEVAGKLTCTLTLMGADIPAATATA